METQAASNVVESAGPEPETLEPLLQNSSKLLSQEQLCGALVEKEYQLECAQDMVQSLSVYEAECKRKDGIIKDLRRELAAFKQNSHSKDINYVAMEEHLAACENHLQLKTRDVEGLKEQVKTVEEKAAEAESKLSMLRTSSSQISALQTELASKTSTILQKNEELQQLRAQHEADEERLTSLRHSITEQRANTASLQTKMKQLRSQNQDLKQKLQTSEGEKQKLSANEQKRKVELGKLKNSVSDGRLAQAKQDFLEAEVEKSKVRENELATQIGRVKEELSTTCQRVISISAGVITPTCGVGCPDIPTTIGTVEQLALEHGHVLEQLQNTQEELTETQRENGNLNALTSSLQQTWSDFKDELSKNTGCPTESAVPGESIKGALETLMTALRNLSSQEKEDHSKSLIKLMEESLRQFDSALEAHVAKWTQLVSDIEGLCDRLECSSKEMKEPGRKIAWLSELTESLKDECAQLKVRLSETEQEHSKALLALKQQGEEQLTMAVEECLAKEREKLANELQALQLRLESEHHQAVTEKEKQYAIICEELKTAKESLLAECSEKDTLNAEKVEVEAKLLSVEETMSEALTTAESLSETQKSQLMEEMMEYKEQSHQHALTIVALEEKLIKLMEKCKQLKEEKEVLSESLHSKDGHDLQRDNNEQVEKLLELTGTLRHQFSLASDENNKHQARIKQLEFDLQTVRSQIQDREAVITRQFDEELNDLKSTLSKQENALERQKTEIDQLTSLLQEKTTQLSAIDTEKSHAVKKLSDMEETSNEVEHGCSDIISTDMIRVGQRCYGEKHCDIIANQREAIAQLREQINKLELAKPPVGSHQATLKELSRVRHELLKAKSQQSTPAANLSKPEPDVPPLNVIEQSESKIKDLQAAVSELQDTLECSEKTYKHLVDVTCKTLAELEKPPVHSFVHGKDQDEKKGILKERKKFADALLQHLKMLLPKGNREGLHKSTTSPQEVTPEVTIANLQAVLESTTEDLEQQRRLNQALVKRSVFRESQAAESSQRVRHKCIGDY